MALLKLYGFLTFSLFLNLVEERGFEPRKSKQLIYSQSPLAAWVFLRQRAEDLRACPVFCQALNLDRQDFWRAHSA